MDAGAFTIDDNCFLSLKFSNQPPTHQKRFFELVVQDLPVISPTYHPSCVSAKFLKPLKNAQP